ncbi:unnamed protein product [Alopecurus aequalis]
MPGRPKTERRREEQEKPKGNKLSRKGCIVRCSACGGENHNRRKCTANPDVMREHAHKKKEAKSAKKKQQKAAAKESTTVQQQPQQQQEKHVLYFEKRAKPRKKAPAQPQAHAMHQGPALHQAATQPQAHALHQAPSLRPFVPPKKKQKNSCDSIGQSSSRPSETIPMSQVVTEQAPKYGRMMWLLGQKQKQGEDRQE